MKFLAILFTLFSFNHPFYLSSFDIKHNSKDKNVEIVIRVFTDDMEGGLKGFKKASYDLSNAEKKEVNNKALQEYVLSKLKIKIDDKQKLMNFIGYEIKKESAWLYLEIENVNSIKNMSVETDFLLEFNNKQNNIINSFFNNNEQTFKLNNETKIVHFK